MTIREVADYLKITEKTAYRLAAAGDLPGFKVGGSWRFRRSEIDRWIDRQSAKKAWYCNLMSGNLSEVCALRRFTGGGGGG